MQGPERSGSTIRLRFSLLQRVEPFVGPGPTGLAVRITMTIPGDSPVTMWQGSAEPGSNGWRPSIGVYG